MIDQIKPAIIVEIEPKAHDIFHDDQIISVFTLDGSRQNMRSMSTDTIWDSKSTATPQFQCYTAIRKEI